MFWQKCQWVTHNKVLENVARLVIDWLLFDKFNCVFDGFELGFLNPNPNDPETAQFNTSTINYGTVQ